MRKHFATSALFAFALFAALALPAAVQAQNIQVFSGDDVNFGTWLPGDGNQVNIQFFCVYKDSGNRRWDVEALGSGAGNAFTLADGFGNTLPIDPVRIRNITMTPGVLETNLPGADNAGAADCTESSGDNQRLRLRLTGADLGSVPPGTYNGTITITVTPN